MIPAIWLPLLLSAITEAALEENSTIDVHATELFILRIDPQKMFGWLRQESLGGDQFSYRPSILGYPDLPPWAQYAHDEHDATGYVFGVPPHGHGDVMLEIVGLNRATYEVQRSQVLLRIHPKENSAIAQVQIKVDNLDVLDLMEHTRIERILEVFRLYLWPEAASNIYVTFLTSAVRLGARLPLKPDEKEGAVIYVGSSTNASKDLQNLQTELEPLSRAVASISMSSTSSFPSLGACPRDFRRASVDRHFRERGFHIDWCAFRLMAWEPAPLIGASPPRLAGDVGLVAGRRRRPLQRPMTPPPRPPPLQMSNAKKEHDPALRLPVDALPIWSRPSLSQVPERNYNSEMIVSILMPLAALVALTTLLSTILCFHHEGPEKAHYPPDCDSQMVRYEAVQRATSSLRSLSRPREFGLTSATPTDMARLSADRDIGRRPLPPPYSGTATARSASSAACYVAAEYRPSEEPKTWFC